jgi:hypothetical protein
LALGKAENRALLLKAGMESFFLYFRDWFLLIPNFIYLFISFLFIILGLP